MLVLLEILLLGHRVVNIQGFSSFKEEKWSKMSKNFIFVLLNDDEIVIVMYAGMLVLRNIIYYATGMMVL